MLEIFARIVLVPLAFGMRSHLDVACCAEGKLVKNYMYSMILLIAFQQVCPTQKKLSQSFVITVKRRKNNILKKICESFSFKSEFQIIFSLLVTGSK